LWDRHKGETLKELIKESFLQNKYAAKQLLSTGDTPLTHNQDKGEYRTLFPKLLMEVRKELREIFPQYDPLSADGAYSSIYSFSDDTTETSDLS
jgi:hypothetical protein